MTTLVALDIESTGLHPGRQAWDVGMIRRDENGESTAQFFIEVDLTDADPFALNIGGFYDRHPLGRYLSRFADDARLPCPGGVHERILPDGLGDYLTPAAAAHVVAAWTHGAHIVGAVPNFDTEVLAALLRAHGLTPAWHYHLVDCEALAVGWLAAQPRYTGAIEPPWKSDDLSEAVGVEPPSDEDRHTALGDARWALAVYDRIVGANG